MKRLAFLTAIVLSMTLSACQGSDSDDSNDDTSKPDDTTTQQPDPDPDGLYEVASAPTFLNGQDPIYSGSSWSRVEYLSDEFNDTKLDTNKWCADPEANGWQWLGRAPQLFIPESVTVNGGTMQILAGILDEPVDKESYGTVRTYKYFGGIVRSLVTGGVGSYYECRMKMNKSELGGGFWLDVQKPINGCTHEIDIQECVGYTSESNTEAWGLTWDHIAHSNAFFRDYTSGTLVEERNQAAKLLDYKNRDGYHVYGAWWKSENEILIFLDGEYLYTLDTPRPLSLPSYVQFSIEMYDWNPVPDEGSQLSILPEEDRISHIDWIRVWEVK